MKIILFFVVVMSSFMAKALDTAFLVADEGNHRIAVYDRNLKLVWDYPAKKPYVAEALENGNILLATGRGLLEVTPEKKVVWSFDRDNHEIYGATRIGDVTVVADCSASEVLFVGSDGKIQKSFKAISRKTGHTAMRTLTVSPKGTILVGHLGDKTVREYDQDGALLNEFLVRGKAYRAVRLENGNTLVGHETGITEFDAEGMVLWDVKPADMPSVRLAFGTCAFRLPNGHTLMGNWLGHSKNKNGIRLFELDKDLKLVWSLPDGLIKDTTAFSPVSDAFVARYTTSKNQADKAASKKKRFAPTQPAAAAVRAAIEDLMITFGADYPRGAEFLEQLDAGADLEPLQREALLANPLLREASLLFATRRQYEKDHHNTATLFQKGEVNAKSYDPPGRIKLLDVKSGEVKMLVDAGSAGIARDPELSPDGNRMIFSMRKSATDDYHIYEINVDGSGLRQLTSLPGVSDIDPVYLPDGKIIFSSTREPKFCMCNTHIMANLYRMDGDGANIHQIGKSTLFEGHSTVMADGRILYDRWEYVDRNFGDAQGLWVTNPDGTLHAIYYGNNTRSPGGVIDARQIPGSQNVICIFGSCHDRPWGALAILDRSKGVDGAAAVEHIWPASARELIGKGNYDTFKSVAPRYEDPFPLADPQSGTGAGKYFLCSRVIQGGSERTGLYLIDIFGNEVLIYEDPDGFGCFDPMPITTQKSATSKPDMRNFENGNGTFYVQDVYEGTHMQGVQRGEVKYLRVVESPEKRSFNGPKWGGAGRQSPGMNWHSFESKRILGTVPVEADGSAYFTVPSDTFFFFQLLDKNGMMIQSMRSGTIIQSGEMQGCVGCHEDRVETPQASAVGLQALKRAPSQMGHGYGAGKLFSYQEEVQPIFDRHCVRCHDFDKAAGQQVNLAGDKELVFNASYVDLHRKQLVTVAGGGPAETFPAKAWGSNASKLTRKLNGHGKARLTPSEKLKIYTWLDLNGIYYPTYSCAYPQNQAGRSPLTKKQQTRLAQLCGNLTFGTGHRNHPGALVSFDRPALSPCLSTLAKGSAEYKEALSIIQQGAENLKTTPRADMPGFVPCAGDLQRTERYEELKQVERSYREAVRTGRKLYDADVQ